MQWCSKHLVSFYMAAIQRGQIISRNRARQIKDFSGLLFGNITPTDIDGLIEYHGKAYVVIELKLSGTPVRYGQKLALERLVDDLRTAGRPSLCIIAEHDIVDTEDAIDVANAIVTEYRQNRQWRSPHEIWTVKGMIEKFLELV